MLPMMALIPNVDVCFLFISLYLNFLLCFSLHIFITFNLWCSIILVEQIITLLITISTPYLLPAFGYQRINNIISKHA